MRLASVEVIPYALPFRRPDRAEDLDRREMVLLRLRTDEGLIGLGKRCRFRCAAARRRPMSSAS